MVTDHGSIQMPENHDMFFFCETKPVASGSCRRGLGGEYDSLMSTCLPQAGKWGGRCHWDSMIVGVWQPGPPKNE